MRAEKGVSDDYKVFGSDVTSSTIPLNTSADIWLDENFDGVINLYAHYETVDNTKFSYDIIFESSDFPGDNIDYNELVNYFDVSNLSITGGSDSITLDNTGTIYNKQNNTLSIKIKTNSSKRIGYVGVDYYNCRNRLDADYARFNTEYTIAWNNYTDRIYQTYSGIQYQYDKTSSVEYNNADEKVKISYNNGEYQIDIKTTIGSIKNNENSDGRTLMYYGGQIKIMFFDKTYDGNIEITSNTSEYEAVTAGEELPVIVYNYHDEEMLA